MIFSDHRKENEECYQYFRKLILKRLIHPKNMRSDFLYLYRIIIKKISQKRLITVKLNA